MENRTTPTRQAPIAIRTLGDFLRPSAGRHLLPELGLQ